MRPLFRPALALLALLPLGTLVACDGEDMEEADPAPLVLTVQDSDGAPMLGVEAWVVYDLSAAARADGEARGGSGGGCSLSAVFPNPVRSSARIQLAVATATSVTLRLENLGGAVVETLNDGPLAPGQYQFVWDTSPLSAGVYAVRAACGADSLARYAVVARPVEGVSEDESELAIALGETDAEGVLRVEDRTRFPSFYDLPEIVQTDEQGSELGTIRFSDRVTLVLRDADGTTERVETRLDPDGNAVDVVLE